MKRLKLSIITLVLLVSGIKAQESNTDIEFKPSGKPYVKIFSNAHTTFINEDNTSAFEIKRAYFGYNYTFSENFSTKITLDVGDPDAGNFQMTVYLKKASLIYKKNNFTANFGLIGLYGFKTQEKHWGYRYLYKSFQDEHKFGSSADLGASFSYKFSDFISADAMILNGEGYKNLQSDNTYKGALGITITPIKNLNIRAYYDLMSTDVAQQTIAFFAGYKADKFKVGAEYNIQNNNKMIEDQDLTGISLYTSVSVIKKLNMFGRLDNLRSNKVDGESDTWNILKDGQAYILGVEYKPTKGIKISPNYQGWSSSNENTPFESSVYLNFEINF
ncbi:MAG: hypothetical protein PF485_02505 [Bacteroidales bacterium]|jgi:hypothetical protein|nr:hypothetical protein [Bacteroidales bacterium]